jgi:hypothetical protein
MVKRAGVVLAFVVGGCATDPPSAPAPDGATSEVDAGLTPGWLPTSWPNDVPDPVAAGERVLELMSGRWRLDFSDVSPGTPCEALDCPGPVDGYDPGLSAAGQGDWDVILYGASVHPPTRLWRELDSFKHVVRVGDTLAIGMGEVTEFYRRAIGGGLLVVRAYTGPELDGPDDFWSAGFVDLGDRIQVTTEDPFGNLRGIHVEIQTQPEAIVIESEGFAFRASRHAEDEVDESLPIEYADLAGDPAPSRAIELTELALAERVAPRTLVAHILHLFTRPEPSVRLAAARYVLASYDWSWNKVSRVILADQLIGRLLQDADVQVRTTVAEGLRTMWTTVPDRYYHCSIDWAVHTCAASDADLAIAAACQEVVDLGRTPYGYCPWLSR